jgi:DNA-binding GntR family transcriptional regulator
VRLPSLTDRVYTELVNAVVAGELAPGDRLTDRRLAEQLGVSRTPIREALQRMVSTGLVDPRGRTGWTVAVLRPRDIQELFELRSLLEPAGVRHIVEDNDPTTAQELSTYFDRFGDSVPAARHEEYLGVDRSFHSRIVGLSSNRRIVAAYRTVDLQIDLGRHRLTMLSQERIDQTLAEHRAIAAAIAAGDLDTALAALHGHLTNGQEMLLETLRARATKAAASAEIAATH